MRISKSILHKVISYVTGILDRKAEGPYSFIKLRNESGYCSVTGVSTLCSTTLTIKSETFEDEEFIASGLIVADIINSLDSEIIDISFLDDKLLFSGNKVLIESNIESVNSLPRELESFESRKILVKNYSLKTLAQNLKIAYRATFEGPSESISSNIHLQNGELRASDQIIYLFTQCSELFNLQFPRSIVPVIVGFAELSPEVDIYISKDESDQILEFSSVHGKLLILNGKAPILPCSAEILDKFNLQNELCVSKEKLQLGLKRALVTTDIKNPEVRLYTNSNKLFIESEYKNYRSIQELCNSSCSINMLLHPKILLDIINFATEEFIMISFGETNEPLLLKLGQFQALIMPLSPTL